jgi:hypothetical protein
LNFCFWYDPFLKERKNEKEQLEWLLTVYSSQNDLKDDILDESEEDSSSSEPPTKKRRLSYFRHKLSLSGRFHSYAQFFDCLIDIFWIH